jgi:hypothetical protein
MRFRLATIFLAIVFALPAEAKEAEIEFLRCPDTYKGEALNGFDIFEGPPDAKEYLIADDDGWDIEASRQDGLKIYLGCRFGKADTLLPIELPPNIDFCKQVDDNVDCR